MIVVDTNVLIHFYYPGEFTVFSEELFLMDPDWIAPILWRSEFKNVSIGFFRKKIVPFSTAISAIELAEAKMLNHEFSTSSILVMDLAKESGCTTYDCEFVALAKIRGVPFITWENRLQHAFPETAVSPKAFLKR